MGVCLAKDPIAWNEIVERSPYSVLHHKYEFYASNKNALALMIRERDHRFLFPLMNEELFRGFRIVTSPIYSHVSILPDTEKAIDSLSAALDQVACFLHEMKVDYLSTCAPTFWSKQYVTTVDSWFKEHKADIQIVYAHMMRTDNTTFEDIWKHKFEKRARNRIRKAAREGVSVTKLDTVEDISMWMDDIYSCNVSALKRQGRWGAYPDSYKEVSLSEYVSAKKRLKEHFNLYGAIYGGRLIAYMVIQEYNKLMQVGKAISHTRFLDKYPNEALVANIAREACERGFGWFEYGWDRVKRKGKLPSLYSSLQKFKFKFGFEEVPILIYRLGLTRKGRAIQRLYRHRDFIITRSAYIPESLRSLFLKFYAAKRRELESYLYT